MGQVIEVVERYILPDFPDIDLPEEDGAPLETNWHRMQINLLIDIVKYRWRAHQDFFVGGNMFVYYSLQQVRNRDYKGPDFFLVKNVDGRHDRRKRVVWEEHGRYPDVIVELLSPSTAEEDLGPKKQLYEQTFRTRNYFCYDPDRQRLQGWHMTETGYDPLEPDAQGRLWSVVLDAWVGLWAGRYQQQQEVWLRLFDADGNLIPTEGEAEYQRAEAEAVARVEAETRAEAEYQRVEAEIQRAEDLTARLAAMEDELRRLRGEA
jgi:Uma2 family endonuclease